MPQATLLLDRAGRLVHANAAADALLRGGDGLTATRNGLAAATAAAFRWLGATIGAAGRRRDRRNAAPAAAVGQAGAALLVAMRGLDDFLFAGHRRAGLRRPAARFAVPARTLAMLFGLTAAEADLATAVLAGQELKAIAAASGRSVNTVRNLLARLMARPTFHRQSELLRMLDRLSQLPRDG